jgi:hypothetical protein
LVAEVSANRVEGKAAFSRAPGPHHATAAADLAIGITGRATGRILKGRENG